MVAEHEPSVIDGAYLERNRLLIAELRDKNVPFVCQGLVGQSSRYAFYSAGEIDSPIMGKPVHLGIKRSTYDDLHTTDFVTRERFLHELAIMSAISNDFPYLTEKLPLIYGLLVNGQDMAIGIVMEDFSEGGVQTLRVGGVTPYEVKKLFVEGSVSDDNLQNCGYTVNGKTRLGDFWYLWKHESREENAKRMRVDRLQERIADFSLVTDLET